jgi:hypothetical protein
MGFILWLIVLKCILNSFEQRGITVVSNTVVPPLIIPPFQQWKSGHLWGLAFLEGDNLVVFYYLKYGLVRGVAL